MATARVVMRMTQAGTLSSKNPSMMYCVLSTPVRLELCPAHSMATAKATRLELPSTSLSRSAPCASDTTRSG